MWGDRRQNQVEIRKMSDLAPLPTGGENGSSNSKSAPKASVSVSGVAKPQDQIAQMLSWVSPVPSTRFGLIQHLLQLQLGQMLRASRAGDPPRASLAVLRRVSTGLGPRLRKQLLPPTR